MHHDDLRELAASYALGAVSGEEGHEVERHLEVCPACAEEVRSLKAVATELAFAAPAKRAPESLRAKVLAAVKRVEPERRSPARALVVAPAVHAWWVAVAATLAALIVGGYALVLNARVRALDAELTMARARSDSAERQLAEARTQLAEAQTQVRVVNVSTGILAAPDVLRVDLKGQGRAAGAAGRAFWSRSRGVLFTANALPALPADRVYQLWVLVGKRADSAGLLRLDEQGRTMIVADTSTDTPTGFAVSVEPSGGVPQPTGSIVLVGTQ
jgi:anti-sigma-K factor RskA